MRQLLPEPTEIDPLEAHATAERPAPAGRPWLALNMVASADGATAVAGRSGALGGAADHLVFHALRSAADVILAAAGTVRAEGYGPPRTTPEQQERRLARGQAAFPRIAVVTGSLDLDPTASLFTDAPEPPVVFTAASAPPDRRAALESVAEVRNAGAERVDMTEMARQLHGLGSRFVLVEGGPILNGQLLAAGLVDELDLTLAPMLVGGMSRRAIVSDLEAPEAFDLAHLWEADGELLARYVRH